MRQWGTRLPAVGCPLSIIRFFAGLFLPVTVILSASEGSRYKTLVSLLSVTTNRRENGRLSDDRLQKTVFLSVRGTILPPLAEYILIARRAIPQPSARRAVKSKNPPAKGRSNLRTFLHNLSTQPSYTTCGETAPLRAQRARNPMSPFPPKSFCIIINI